MTECDAVVHLYLLSVSDKLAKQFRKKKPTLLPWTGPRLDKLIDFYKRDCKEGAPAQPLANGATQTKEVTNSEKRKGKKRKLGEMMEPVATETPSTNGTTESKKKKKKKKKQPKEEEQQSPDIVEVIPDSPGVETAPEETAPEETAPVVGGMVGSNKKSKLKRKASGSSFRRIKEEDVVIRKKELADNTFEAKRGDDDFGYKANQILKFTKGKSFRHEKTKKKRGTYKGGAINMGVTSVKFDSESE